VTIGITADVSATGCALLWPVQLRAGERLPVRIHFGPRSADWLCEVVTEKGQTSDGWHLHGVRFVNATQADIDLVNDSVFNLVVPDLFSLLSQPAWIVRCWRRVHHWSRGRFHRPARELSRVPLRVRHPHGGFMAAARDVSSTGMSLASPVPLAVGTPLEITMCDPGGSCVVPMSVARSVFRRSREGLDTWILGLSFDRQPSAEERDRFGLSDAA
jgi:hypothetical protein